MRAKDALGQSGKRLAADCLEEQEVRVIDSNWRCPNGGIDLVAGDGGELGVMEFNNRSLSCTGPPVIDHVKEVA